MGGITLKKNCEEDTLLSRLGYRESILLFYLLVPVLAGTSVLGKISTIF